MDAWWRLLSGEMCCIIACWFRGAVDGADPNDGETATGEVHAGFGRFVPETWPWFGML